MRERVPLKFLSSTAVESVIWLAGCSCCCRATALSTWAAVPSMSGALLSAQTHRRRQVEGTRPFGPAYTSRLAGKLDARRQRLRYGAFWLTCGLRCRLRLSAVASWHRMARAVP